MATATEMIAESPEASYRSLFNGVSLAATETTRFLNRFAFFAIGGEDARAELQDDVLLLIDTFDLLLEQLEAAEPVPVSMAGAHVLTKTAIDRYRAAAKLLLPPAAGGPAVFEFSRFQELMLEGGKRFHGAGSRLP